MVTLWRRCSLATGERTKITKIVGANLLNKQEKKSFPFKCLEVKNPPFGCRLKSLME